MDQINYKVIVPVALISLLAGGLVTYFVSPTKVKTLTETKVEVKTVKEQVYVDRIITKITKPDGTIEEKIEEKDRSTKDSIGKSSSESKLVEVSNPKNLGLAIVGKASVIDLKIPTYRDLGVQINYDLGVFNTFITGTGFIDGTVVIGIGIKF